MTLHEAEAVPTVPQIDQAAHFVGFTPEDFAIFEVSGFAARMPLLRAHITPKLKQIGQALAERMSNVLAEPVYPHVAQHLRRTVNAPEATWVAFSRLPRAYKPVVHLRAAIQAEQFRVTAFVEDYAEDKLLFADNLARNADALEAYLTHHPTLRAYDIRTPEGEPAKGHELDATTLRAFAERMHRVKGQHAVFGIAFDREHPVLQSGPELLDAILEAAHVLRPLYDCGRTADFQYTYSPL